MTDLLSQITTAANSNDPALMKKVLCLVESVMMAEAMATSPDDDWEERGAADELRAAVIKECAACVPTNWCDELLTGPGAPKHPLDNRGVEQVLRGIQDRIRALPTPYTLKEIRDGRAEG